MLIQGGGVRAAAHQSLSAPCAELVHHPLEQCDVSVDPVPRSGLRNHGVVEGPRREGLARSDSDEAAGERFVVAVREEEPAAAVFDDLGETAA